MILKVVLAAGLQILAVYVTSQPSYASDGRTLFNLHCAGCHGLNGSGSPEIGVPTFEVSLERMFDDPRGRLYVARVPNLLSVGLNNAEIARVLNYMVKAWAPKHAGQIMPYDAAEVHELRAKPIADIVDLRRQITRSLAKRGVMLSPYPWP